MSETRNLTPEELSELCGAVCSPFRANCMLPAGHQGPHSPTRPLNSDPADAPAAEPRAASAVISWEDEKTLREIRSIFTRAGVGERGNMERVLVLTRILDQLARSGSDESETPAAAAPDPAKALAGSVRRLTQYVSSQKLISEGTRDPLISDLSRVLSEIASGDGQASEKPELEASVERLRRYVRSGADRVAPLYGRQQRQPRVGDVARVLHLLQVRDSGR